MIEPENLMIEINTWDEVPQFNNEDEEAEFWSHHCLGDEALEKMESLELLLPIEQAILDKLRHLSVESQKNLLDFADFLYHKEKATR